MKNYSYSKEVIYLIKKKKTAMAGLCLVLFIVLMALLAPVFSKYSYSTVDLTQQCITPCIEHWFGTDTLGRDLFTRVWQGTRVSLFIALVAITIDLVVGVSYGMISGFYGGKVDILMQRFAEVLNGIPTLVLVVLLGLVFKGGIVSIILAFMILGWIDMQRIARAQTLKLKEQEFILAAKTIGMPNMKIIFSEILPNIWGPVMVEAMIAIPSAIFTESFLSFLGVGIQPPGVSLGTLVSEGYTTMLAYPYMLLSPAVVLVVFMIAFNLFADGLKDALDLR